ncbi:HET-domain-containing protein [Apiospora rasikravindrae]|uniref:HET-domain-containing protein n=1 Tax=Apiospora rasikravindrae TaxID=990691 RepID=A0ABR1T2V9_9PEZI
MGTSLCERCKCLELDDADLGGFDGASSTQGRSFLAFDKGDDARNIPLDYRFEDWLPDLPRLAESGRNGCDFCKLLRQSLFQAGLAKASDPARVILSMAYVWKTLYVKGYRQNSHGYPDRGLVALVVRIDSMPVGPADSRQQPPPMSRISFDVDSEPGPCQSWLRLETSPRPDVLDAANVAMMRQSIDSQRPLRLPHGKPTDESLFPARLIDLGNGEDALRCRLVLTHGEHSSNPSPQESGYAALSYCWGNAAEAACQFKTEPHSLAKRLSGFDVTDTTAVVQDAIKVCRALGIRYLWVDAVCIVQGDKDDWERESQKMSSIYHNAAATICPISSNSCLEGFLHRTSHSVQVPFRSKVNKAIQGEFTLRYTNTKFSFMDVGDPASEDLAECKWKTRGWCFQEFHSSRLLIIFGPRKIQIITTEGVVVEGAGENSRQLSGLGNIPTLDRYVRDGVALDELVYHDHWMAMVELYGIRDLSYETDRLSALSGLASLFKRALPLDRYLAGLWERDIHRQLFWNTSGTSHRSLDDLVLSLGQVDGLYIAPSWSWMRKKDLISFGYDKFNMDDYADYRSECHHLRSSITPDGLDPTGKLRDASLLICSRFMPIPYTAMMDRESPQWQLVDDHMGYVADCELDWVEKRSDEETDGDEKRSKKADNRNGEVAESGDAKMSSGERDLALLLLGSCTEPNDDGRPSGTKERYAWGIVICAAPEIDPMAYVRVGTFYSDPADNGGLKLFKKCQQGEFPLK